MYAIIDLETTGSIHYKDRITEIAVYVHDGASIVDEFVTLVNPGRSIPPFITKLTGISNKMVKDAPYFHQIAKSIVELTEGTVFVAHNSSFDYHFLKSEFKALGYEFRRDSLCTVELSREYLPGKASYSLGKLCREMGIPLEGRHRASGDALATVKLFETLLEKAPPPVLEQHLNLDTYSLKYHSNIPKQTVQELEDEPGVYYFHNAEGDILYIGKSKNVRARVMSHFNKPSTKKAEILKKRVADISVEYTGSELVALLLEAEEVKKHQPPYNSELKKPNLKFGIFSSVDGKGYINYFVGKVAEQAHQPIGVFHSANRAKKLLEQAIEKYTLCQKLTGTYPTNGECFHYMVKKCAGACLGKETPEVYNQRARLAEPMLRHEYRNFFIVDRGRYDDEYAVIQIENGYYTGYGYIDKTEGYKSVKSLKDAINPYPANGDIAKIIGSYLRKKKVVKTISY